MSQGTKQQAVRLPLDLHAKIVAAATENNRSGHAEMLHRLEQSFTESNGIVRGDLNALEERLLKKLAPEVFVTDLSIGGGVDMEALREVLKGDPTRPGLFFPSAKISQTGRLRESQPEISGLTTLPQAIRRGHTEHLPLEGQTWVITGSLETMSRDKARDYLIQMGAEVAGVVVAGKTCGLLWGPGAGSKLVKAKQHGVQLMDEVGFLDLLRAMAILPPEAEDQHLTIPGALDWDNPDDGWTENTGSMPVQPRTLVKWRVRGGFGNTPEDVQGPEPASAIDWTLEDEPDAFDIMLWRLA